MPKSRSRIKRGVKYDDKHEHEIGTLSQRRLVADAYWRTQDTGGTLYLWTWYIKENGLFTIENFKKVASKDLDLDCVDDDGQPLYPSISRIQPEPLFDIIWNSSNPAWVPRQPTNKPKSKIDILKVQEYLRPWFYEIDYVMEDPEYPGFVYIGTRYTAELHEQMAGTYTIYLCGVCCNEMSLSKEDVKNHLSTKHDCEAFVPSTERLSKPKTAKRKYQPKKHPSRSSVPLEILPEEPIEKIRHIVRRNRGPNRRYMDSVSKKRMKPATSKQITNVATEVGPVVEIPITSSSHDTRELEEVIVELECEIRSNGAQKEKQEWKERLEAQNESWEKMRPVIGEEIGRGRITPKDEAVECHMCQNSAVLRCVTCSKFLCKVCDTSVHNRNPFHQREHWLNGAFQPLTCLETVESNRIDACCSFLPMATSSMMCDNCDTRGNWKLSGKEYQKMIVVTLRGRYDVQLEVLLCENCAIQRKYNFMDFYNSGYFPGSATRFISIYALDLLEFCAAVQYNSPGLTLNSIAKSLEGMNKHGTTINQSVFAKALEEFGFLQHDLAKLRGEDGFICPSCTPDTHSIMVDGNMKLKRLSSVSRGERNSYFGSELFIPDDEVDQHVLLQRSATKTSNADVDICGQSHWKAAKERSHRMARLDQTGVFGSTCRHVVPQKLMNMFQGEIFAYAHCMHSYFVNNTSFQYLWYDIICQYWKYCERIDSDAHSKALTAAVEPALPLMHAKGHSSTCQILWGGDWKAGAGTTSGEETEQFWSYLSNACKPTKYMGCARREEAITRLASFWGRRKVNALPQYLSRRYQKVKKLITEAQEELARYKEYDLTKMKQELLDHVKESSNSSGVSPEVEYFQLKKEEEVFIALNSGQPDPISRIVTGTVDLHQTLGKKHEQRVKRLEQLEKNHSQSIEQAQKSTALDLMATKRNEIELHVHTYNTREEKFVSLAETSKERHKLRKANQNTKKNIEKALQIYNIAAQDAQNEDFTQVNSTELPSIMKGNFPWNPKSNATFGKKREIINKKESVDRLKEEEILLKKEMKQFLLYYNTRASENTSIDVNTVNINSYMRGLVSTPYFADEARVFAKLQVEKGIKYFKHIDDEIVGDNLDSDNDSNMSDMSDLGSDIEG